MKIEFEIDEKYAAELIDLFEFAASKTKDSTTFETIQKVIKEIKDDLNNGVEVFQELQKRLLRFTDGSQILWTSDFRNQLGISKIFIASDEGLIKVLNAVLIVLVKVHKPGAQIKLIKKSSIDDAGTIEDLVNLILRTYESIH